MTIKDIDWIEEDERHYKAAYTYLTLLVKETDAVTIVSQLRDAPVSEYRVNDILRASGLPLLSPMKNDKVKKDLDKIKKAKAIQPVLIVRDRAGARCVIADGYHRICAFFFLDPLNPETIVRCKIV